MKATKWNFYLYLFSAVALIASAEAVLEFRHYLKGYDTLIFGVKPQYEVDTSSGVAESKNTPKSEFGPTQSFPFKSKIIKAHDDYDYRIWVASASHAHGGSIQADSIFPNLICNTLKQNKSCIVINGSELGMTVSENIALLKQHYSDIKPQFSILYQLSITVSGQQRKLINAGKVGKSNSNSLLDFKPLIEVFQKTALYGHLSSYIGGNIKLQGSLHDDLPKYLEKEFDKEIISFIEACHQLGTQPILTTFAASHNRQNLDQMRFDIKTNFVKYNTYLSPIGWTKIIKVYNQRIRDIAANQSIPLIDLEASMNGKSEYFMDFVHLNKSGHKKFAELIGTALDEIIGGTEQSK